MSRTKVDIERFLFVSDVLSRGSRVSVAIHWTGLPFVATSVTLAPLSEFLAPRPEVSEVWFVAPEDVRGSLIDLHNLDEYEMRASSLAGICYRFFTVASDGQWSELIELRSDSYDQPVAVGPIEVEQVRTDGMRQLFRDTDSLVSASAGFHFERPGRGHSEYFIRTSAAVSRTQHAYFIASAALSQIDAQSDMKLYADTAGIMPLLAAVKDLLHRLQPEIANVSMDSFGGYDGASVSFNPVWGRDIVIISSSTSGSLAKKLIEEGRAENDRTLTVFYLCEDVPSLLSGRILCDLTNRDAKPLPSVRDARRFPYPSYRVTDAGGCELCEVGSHPIELAGDDFFPSPSDLQLRMPVFGDRPYRGRRERAPGERQEFDGSDYFHDFFGLGAITLASGAAEDSRGGNSAHRYGVSTRIGHLLVNAGAESLHILGRLEGEIRSLVGDGKDISAIASLPDSDSRGVAEFAANLIFGLDKVEVTTDLWRVAGTALSDSFGEALDALPTPSTVLVCAGVIGSGRALLNLSRTLRHLPEDVQTVYFVAVAHPESANARSIFESSLGVRSSGSTSTFKIAWELPREPGTPGTPNAWERERRTLGKVEQHLAADQSDVEAQRAVQYRLEQLSDLDANDLFASPLLKDGDPARMPAVNPKFALWSFEWSDDPRAIQLGVAPTPSEIFATVAHLLYESRRSSTQLDARPTGVRRHGFALNPAIFDRFNEPQLQSSILRAVEPGELDYHSAADASRAAADIVKHVVENAQHEGGGAAYELLLSIADGIRDGRGPGLKLSTQDLKAVLTSLGRESNFVEHPPLVRAMLSFIAASG